MTAYAASALISLSSIIGTASVPSGSAELCQAGPQDHVSLVCTGPSLQAPSSPLNSAPAKMSQLLASRGQSAAVEYLVLGKDQVRPTHVCAACLRRLAAPASIQPTYQLQLRQQARIGLCRLRGPARGRASRSPYA